MIGLAIGDQQWIVPYGSAVRLPGRDEPFGPGTRTDAGSLTKIIATTPAVLRLVDAARIGLDDQIADILGGGPVGTITVRDLLEHQAGLWEWWPLYLTAADHRAAADLINSMPPRYQRRSGRHYSDLGFMLLGEVIEKVTGTQLDQACADLVFDPFGLAETGFARPMPGDAVAASSNGDRIERTMITTGVPYPVDGSVDDFAGWRQHILIGEVNDGNSFHAFGSVAGHAGVFTTAGDLLRFGWRLIDSLGGHGPISTAAATGLVTPGEDQGQALGFRIWPTAAGKAVGHTGFPGVGFALLPSQDTVIAMITNRLHVDGTPRNLEQLWLTVLTAVAR